MERKFIILTDSCCDLPKQVREEYDVDYVKMNITFDGKELPASLDDDVFTMPEFFGWMREGKLIKTTQVPTSIYYEKFTNYVENGYDVLYIACSSALSGSYNTSCVIREQVLEEHKDAKIYIVDALNSCYAEGMMVMKASNMRKEGKTIDEVYTWLEENKLKFNQVATVDSLEYLKRAGRVKTTAAFFGKLFAVKPIIISDAIGQNFAFQKAKGRRASIEGMVKIFLETVIEPENQTIYISHADCLEDAKYLESIIIEAVKPKNTEIHYIGPIVGASVGPGTLCIYYMGKEVTVNKVE